MTAKLCIRLNFTRKERDRVAFFSKAKERESVCVCGIETDGEKERKRDKQWAEIGTLKVFFSR